MSHKRAQSPPCTVQVACDGEPVKTDKGMCGWCERAIAKRKSEQKRRSAPLRGEHYLAAEAARGR